MENYEKAVSYYSKAIKADPTYIPALINKGACLYNLNRWQEAV